MSLNSTPTPQRDWEPPSVEELETMLPGYLVSAIIGRGGMGAVYRATQTRLNRDVAIKLLPEYKASDEDDMNYAARFELEAQTMAQLNHPAIVSVYDFGETAAGQLYFVMEFVEGMDIHQYIASNGGILEPDAALAITAHVLDALDYAHARGIVHRDIKPANVLLNKRGQVKVADFGLAKMIGTDNNVPALTMENVALGTPDYVAPETLDAAAVADHRADIYAVGVMLYQMLTGNVPRGNFKLPSEICPGIHTSLDTVVLRAMESDPNDRYPTASEARLALDSALSQPISKIEAAESDGEENHPKAVPSASVKGNTNGGLKWGIGIAATLIAAAAAFLLISGGEEPVAVTSPTVASVTGPSPNTTAEAPQSKGDPKPVEPAQKAAPEPASPNPPKPAQPKELAKALSTESFGEPQEPAEAPPAKKHVSSESPEAKAPVEPAPVAATSDEPPEATAAPTPDKPTDAPSLTDLVPELSPRLERYLTLRRGKLTELANRYSEALNGKLREATQAGDLGLVKAFRTEIQRVETLQEALKSKIDDPVSTVEDSATLRPLPNTAPPSLVELRKTWTRLRAEIANELNPKLQQSLTFLEQKLVREEDIANADRLHAWKNSLQSSGTLASTTETTEEKKKAEPIASSSNAESDTGEFTNPFGWKPIPEEPFPLPMPQRSTTPCRLVAWRLDGEPIEDEKFRTTMGGLPAELGEIVDFATADIIREANDFKLRNSFGITENGNVVTFASRPLQKEFSSTLSDVVQMESGIHQVAALHKDGTVSTATFNPGFTKRFNAYLEEAETWQNIVRIAIGEGHLLGLASDGNAFAVGDNRDDRSTLPGATGQKTVSVGAHMSSTWLVTLSKDKELEILRLGPSVQTYHIKQTDRIFLGQSAFFADARGRLEDDSITAEVPYRIENIRGAPPSDVLEVRSIATVVEGRTNAIGWAREGDDKWKFWGETPDFSAVDRVYCENKAEGCWKVFISSPYVLGLKPVANLKDSDWTGGSSPEQPEPVAAPSNHPREKAFPLPLPKRPDESGNVIVLRRDGKPLAERGQSLQKWAQSLGTAVVSLDAGFFPPKDDGILALTRDGHLHQFNSKKAESVPTAWQKQIKSNIVKTAFGSQRAAILCSDGTGYLYDYSRKELESVNLPEGELLTDISCQNNYACALTTAGTIVPISVKPSFQELQEYPKTVALATAWGGWAFGIDGRLRSWYQVDGKTLANSLQFSGGIKSSSGFNADLVWIDSNGLAHGRSYFGGTIDGKFFRTRNDFEEVHLFWNLRALKTSDGNWVLRGGDKATLYEKLSRETEGCSALTADETYIFAIRPLGN